MTRLRATLAVVAHLGLVGAVYSAPGRWFTDGSVGAALALTVIATCVRLAPFKRTGAAERRRAWRGLFSSMGHAAVHAGLLVTTVSVDRFAIFDGWYLAMVGACLPGLAILLLSGHDPGGSRAVGRMALPLSCSVFSLTHLWAVHQAALSV